MNYLIRALFMLMLVSVTFTTVDAQKKGTQKKTVKKTATKAVAKPAAKEPVITLAADTTAPKVVTITSAFKPYLKNAAKVNFTAASPVIDSSKIPVVYSIPSQNLFFSYQPVTIKPLALAVDSGFTWNNDQYIKLGAGNFSSVLGEAAFSFGDGKNSITNLRGNFVTATGHLPAQQTAKWGIDVVSIFNTNNNNEWTAHPYYKSSTQYQYGYQPTTLNYAKDQLLQKFNTVGAEVGLQNKTANSFGITYHPQIHFIRFSDSHENRENDLVIKAPINKAFGKIYSLDLDMGADLSTNTIPMIPNWLDLKNNLFYVNPSLQFKTPNVKIIAGIRPSWDDQVYATLPNVTAEAKIADAVSLEAGWVGYYQKNTLRSLANINPWIGSLTGLKNTLIKEQYAGIKGATGDHFTYQARVSFQQLTNQALFVNNTTDGKTFTILFEPSMSALKLHGELAYTLQENVSIMAGVTYSQYSSLAVNKEAWGLMPLEATGSVKWKILKDLQLKADVFLWNGSPYRDSTLQAKKLNAVADLNFGAEFSVMPRLNIWLQMNNLLNSTYQRWNQYPVLGTQVLAGVVYSFR